MKNTIYKLMLVLFASTGVLTPALSYTQTATQQISRPVRFAQTFLQELIDSSDEELRETLQETLSAQGNTTHILTFEQLHDFRCALQIALSILSNEHSWKEPETLLLQAQKPIECFITRVK